MLLTEVLKKFLRDNFGVPATATDDDYRKSISENVVSGKLTPDKLAELSKQAENAGNSALRTELKSFVAELDIGGQIKAALAGLVPAQTPPPAPPAPPPAPDGAKDQAEIIAKLVEAEFAKRGGSNQAAEAGPHALLTRDARTEGGVPAHQVRVKAAIERYDNSKSTALHARNHPVDELRERPVVHMGRTLNNGSAADKAVIGVFTKWSAGLSMRTPGYKMSEHDLDVLEYAIRDLPWVGHIDGDGDGSKEIVIDHRKLTEFERKALLNDAISGGVNAVPVVYDDQAILAPIQTGELFPWVGEVRPLSRGRTVRSLSVGTPTLHTGIDEGTAIPLFDTTGFIAALDTSVYPITGAIEIGLDFEEDSLVNIGQIVIEQYGRKHLEWLDNVVAIGDGTNEPLGIFNTGTMTIVPSVNGLAGPVTLADLESLIFGVNRLYRRARGGRMAFIMNDITYRRFRTIAQATGWNTRLFGQDGYQEYTLCGYPVRIIPGVPNNKVAFVNMEYYRMYRRQGLQVRVETGGKELARRHVKLILVRALWGGRLMDGGAGAVMTDLAA